MYISELKSKQLLNFDGALYNDSTDIPFYYSIVDEITNSVVPNTEITNCVYQELPATDFEILKKHENLFSDKIEINTRVSFEKKRPYLVINFLPFRKNSLTGKLERLVSFSLNYNYNKSSTFLPNNTKAHSYVANSVLRTGDWFKINILTSGIHIITYDDLVALGISPGQIDPRNIRVYGNGGKMLPENNATFRYDDLLENSIYVFGESDGKFDQGDYILFYGQGPEYWIADTLKKIFRHQLNKYTRTASYFITTSLGLGQRIQNEASLTLPPDYTVSEFNDYAFHEKDSLNLIKSGREFYGEVFDVTTSYTFGFNFPNIVSGSTIHLNTNVLARSVGYASSFKLYINGAGYPNIPISATSSNYLNPFAQISDTVFHIPATNSISLRIDYNKAGNSSAVGWLNYIELNAIRNLSFVSGQMPFRNIYTIGKGVSEFNVGNANSNVSIWDISNFTNPKLVNASLIGSNLSFRVRTDSLKEFVAFDGSSFNPVITSGKIQNQNLHGLSQNDMIIVTYPDFAGEASRLADMHRTVDNLSVVVTTPQEIFNEFSSGNQDITAIKDFTKMFYDRAGGNTALMPKYLLLFGDASYDAINRLSDNTNFVPIYETENSLDPTSSFATDDYVGFLDDSESGAYDNLLDIGVGRIPAKTIEDAQAITNKILNYVAKYDLNAGGTNCTDFSSSVSNLSDWRNVLCFVADDNDDGESFLRNSEDIANFIDTTYNNFNIDKIYLDAFPQISTPGGQRSQECTDAINQRVEKGALIMNYIGHGGEQGWTHEEVIGVSDINNWTNRYNTPLFVTATCEFSRCDDPVRVSAGEYVLTNPNGGGVGLFTTSRLAWSGSNYTLNYTFYRNAFVKTSGVYPCLGDVIKAAKNYMGCQNAISNFLLLGDPALRLAYPQYNVVTSNINNHPLPGVSDTIRAMSKVTVKGYIADDFNVKQTGFNGIIVPIVFDKPTQVSTLGSDGAPQLFKLQKNVVFKGRVSVINGDFSFSFIVPKDIASNFGKGRISYYAQNGTSDANGYYENNNFIIGGSSNNAITDNIGPEMRIYLNDNRFVSGGITNDHPVLLTYLTDTSGLNTVGNGIGHDISAVLDDNTERTYVLNDYYESELNTYQRGIVRYPFTKLSSGTHKLKVKAWDVFNNSSESEIEFVVAESADLALTHVLNYPNPFTTYTEFWFEHNQPCCGLEVQIQIFTISGKLIKTIQTTVETNGFRAEPIPWDGKDDYGDDIGRGVYIYMLKVKNSSGQLANKIEKLVILK
ncbi:MAG: type IX secretion system sortase PorU [Bacteroidota bacterium]